MESPTSFLFQSAFSVWGTLYILLTFEVRQIHRERLVVVRGRWEGTMVMAKGYGVSFGSDENSRIRDDGNTTL